MARREPTQPVDFLRDVALEEEVTKPNAMMPSPGRVWAAAATLPQAPRTEVDVVAPSGRPVAPARPNLDVAQLRRMLEFAQWERVAMVRFGLADAAWATGSIEPISIFSHRADAGDIDELRRNWERARAMVRDNHEALEKALEDLADRLHLSDGDFI